MNKKTCFVLILRRNLCCVYLCAHSLSEYEKMREQIFCTFSERAVCIFVYPHSPRARLPPQSFEASRFKRVDSFRGKELAEIDRNISGAIDKLIGKTEKSKKFEIVLCISLHVSTFWFQCLKAL